MKPATVHLKVTEKEAAKIFAKTKQNNEQRATLRDLTQSIVSWKEFQVKPHDLPNYSAAVHKMFQRAIAQATADFEILDRDQDGKISRDEFLVHHPKEADSFAKADTDKNGELSFTELIRMKITELEAKIIRPENVPGYTDMRR